MGDQSATVSPQRPSAAMPAGVAIPDPTTQPYVNTTGAIASRVILLAEDDADTRALIVHLLRREGYEVLIAKDGAEVFDILPRRVPGLFLLDCDMPRMNGFEVCRRLKADARYSELPVIFMSAWSSPEDKATGFGSGGDDYVTKPIEKIELLARIRSHIELAISRHALRRRAALFEALTLEQAGLLDDVRSGQESLLTPVSAVQGLTLGVRFQPAHHAGGDFYEIARLADDEYGLLVCDVSGHDLSVPYITGALKALSATFINETLSPQETMLLLNSSLLRFLSDEHYVTAGYARFSRTVMEVSLISAGHPPAAVQRADGSVEYVTITGDVLGMFEHPVYETQTVEVAPGDRLFLYTDGLIESYWDDSGRSGRALYGMERLRQALAVRRAVPVAEAVDGVVAEVLQQCEGVADDDIVVVGAEF